MKPIEEEAQLKRFTKWSILRVGLPWAAGLAVIRAWRDVDGEIRSIGFVVNLVLYLAVLIPASWLLGWVWARGMWMAGFGRRLPGDDGKPR